MNILFVYEGKLKGHGLDLVVHHQLRALSEAGHSTLLVARGKVEMSRIRCHPIRWSWAKMLSWSKKEIYYAAQQRAVGTAASALISGGRFELVVAWQRTARPVFLSAKKAKIHRVLCSASAFAFKSNLPEKPKWPKIGNAYLREEYALADRILAPSAKAASDYIQGGLPAEKIVSIERGFDSEVFYPASVRPPGFRVLFCGRICARKGVPQLLRAWVDAAIPGAELWLVGSIDGEMQPVVAEYQSKPGIRFLGFRADVGELMRQCHVHALLSSHESMGKSLIEAAASGLVNLTTDGVGFPVQDGFTGVLVNREDHGAVVDALCRLASDTEFRSTIAHRAREMVSAEYSWERFRQRFVESLRFA